MNECMYHKQKKMAHVELFQRNYYICRELTTKTSRSVGNRRKSYASTYNKVHRFSQKEERRWRELPHEYQQHSFTIFL